MKHVKRFDREDHYAFAGAVEFPGGGDPVTWEGEVLVLGCRHLVKMVASPEGVEWHYDVGGDPRCLTHSSDAEWSEHEIDALVGMVKDVGSLDFLMKMGFEQTL